MGSDSIGMIAVFGTTLAVIGGGALASWWANRRPWEHIDREGSTDGCVACGSTDVVVPVEGVYLCTQCGYEGGPGLAVYQWKQRLERIDQLPTEKRSATGVAAVKDARLALLAAKGDIASAQEALEEASKALRAQKSGSTGLSPPEDLAQAAFGLTTAASLRLLEARDALSIARHIRSGKERLGWVDAEMDRADGGTGGLDAVRAQVSSLLQIHERLEQELAKLGGV